MEIWRFAGEFAFFDRMTALDTLVLVNGHEGIMIFSEFFGQDPLPPPSPKRYGGQALLKQPTARKARCWFRLLPKCASGVKGINHLFFNFSKICKKPCKSAVFVFS
ncbi:MAG TPA: hypothetical protein VG347_02130 [Verrucomicrobiae bacterium]|nr:hypothetical protein [Verrucomicrobiae bacterium]